NSENKHSKSAVSIDYFLKFKYSIIILVIIGIVLFIFTRDIIVFVRLFFAFIIIVYIPGYLLSLLLFPDWGNLEKSIISAFVGIAPVSLVGYWLSIFGIKTINIWFALICFVISLILIFVIINKRQKV
ncbi:MAG: hypothetical protein QXG00_01305, partial [Candidatus Woesearchaeota archaeon]